MDIERGLLQKSVKLGRNRFISRKKAKTCALVRVKLYLPFGGSASTIHACNATAGKQNALVQIYQFLYVRGCDPKFVRGSHTRIKSRLYSSATVRSA